MNIGISGAFCDNNFGDYTMLINNVYDLADSNAKIDKLILFCYDTEIIYSLKEKYLANFDFDIEIVKIECSMKKDLPSNYFGIDSTEELLMPLEILQTVNNLDYIKSKVREIDLMIANGGGYFDYYWLGIKRRYKFYSIVAPLIIARQFNKKIVTLGNSFGPWGRNRDFFFMLFNYINFDLINCRDNLYSKKFLYDISVTDNIVEVCDDLIKINPKITESRRPANLNIGKYFVIDLYSSTLDIEHHIDKIIAFVKFMKTNKNLTPVFLKHGLEYNGTRQAHLLQKFIPDLIIYDNENFYIPIEDFCSVLNNAEFVLCEHYHTFVLAITNKIPAVMFIRKIDGASQYYYNKTVGFLRNIEILKKNGVGEDIFCVTKLEDLFYAPENFFEHLQIIQGILEKTSFDFIDKKKSYIQAMLNLNDTTYQNGGGYFSKVILFIVLKYFLYILKCRQRFSKYLSLKKTGDFFLAVNLLKQDEYFTCRKF